MTPPASIYSVSDLIGGGDVFKSLSPPARLAVFGDPVAHSISPVFQSAALRACGIDMQYVAIRVTPEELVDALRALPAADFVGANLTLPHKSAALEFLDDVDAPAQLMGAANTVLVDGERLAGFNTDGPGLVRAIREEFSVDIRDLRVMVLGAGGGAGRSIAVQCALEGCERLVLVNRTVEKVAALAEEIAPYFQSDRLAGPAERIAAIGFDPPSLLAEIEHTDLIINATSVGMKRTDPRLLPESALTANLLVYDTVYSTGDSRLVRDARTAGARAANGLSMLLHQGALSMELWFERPAPLDVMRNALGKH